jgi:hypothetical protein
MNNKGVTKLKSINRCRIDDLRLTDEQWDILLECAQHNLRNALSTLVLASIRTASLPMKDAAEECIDRVIGFLETLEEVRRQNGHR